VRGEPYDLIMQLFGTTIIHAIGSLKTGFSQTQTVYPIANDRAQTHFQAASEFLYNTIGNLKTTQPNSA